MDNNLNNSSFINKKNDMQRSTVTIAILLGIIIFLLIVIGYLIYINLKRPDEVIVNKCENEPKVVEKEEDKEEEVEQEPVIISDDTLNSLITLLPKILTTNYLDYNLFTKSGLTKDEIEKIKTPYDEENFKEVYYLPYQIEVTKKNTVLYLYVVIYDKKNNLYYDSSALDKEIANPLFDKNDQEQLKKYGGRYKITYVNGAFGYLLNGIEFINGKR